MECDFCHEREAVIFVEQISNQGNKKQISICMECAVARGITPDPKNIEANIGELFKELTNAAAKIDVENKKLCPVCASSLSEIRKNFKAGCPECYAIFKKQILESLKSHGITGNYSGSMPSRLPSFHSVLNYRIMLHNKLDAAVKNEDYEKAAMYRDYLHALEKQPVSGDKDSEGKVE